MSTSFLRPTFPETPWKKWCGQNIPHHHELCGTNNVEVIVSDTSLKKEKLWTIVGSLVVHSVAKLTTPPTNSFDVSSYALSSWAETKPSPLPLMTHNMLSMARQTSYHRPSVIVLDKFLSQSNILSTATTQPMLVVFDKFSLSQGNRQSLYF